MEHAKGPIIFDIGSTVGKAGFIDQVEPRKWPSLVSYPKCLKSAERKHIYVGDSAVVQRPLQVYEYPVHRGLITDWNYIERMWRYAFEEFNSDPEEHPVMLLEHPLTPKSAREKTTQTMFETFKVPALFMANPCVASLRAVGRTTGVAVSMGGQTTYSMAVKDGKGMIETLNSIDIGSQDVVASFMKSMIPENWDSGNLAYQNLAAHILRKIGYIALDYNTELQKRDNEVSATYEDQYCALDYVFHHERFMHTEIVFTPELFGLEKSGIHDMIYNSVNKCEPSIQSELFKNIVLSGGNSLTRGLDARLIKELQILSPEHSKHMRIESGPNGLSRWDLPFIGAAQLGETLTDWMTKAEYDEVGPLLVHDKCPIGVW